MEKAAGQLIEPFPQSACRGTPATHGFVSGGSEAAQARSLAKDARGS